MATPKQAHALSSYYMKVYKEHYGFSPSINRHSARWSFDSILMDLTPSEVEGLLDYYFTTNSKNHHELEWFFYNYSRLKSAKETHDADVERQEEIKKETRKRVEEWRAKRNGK